MVRRIILKARPDLVEKLNHIKSANCQANGANLALADYDFCLETLFTEELDVSHIYNNTIILLSLDIAKYSQSITRLNLSYTDLNHLGIKIAPIIASFPKLKSVDLSHIKYDNKEQLLKTLLISKSISYINFTNNVSDPSKIEELASMVISHNDDQIEFQEKQKNDIYQYIRQGNILPLPDVCAQIIGDYSVDMVVLVKASFDYDNV